MADFTDAHTEDAAADEVDTLLFLHQLNAVAHTT
jgi:hypothetical protein